MDTNSAVPRWRVIGFYVLFILLPCAFLVGLGFMAVGVPWWSLSSAAAAGVGGALFAWRLLARTEARRRGATRKESRLSDWVWIPIVGFSGPFIAQVPDRYAVILVSFLAFGFAVLAVGRIVLRVRHPEAFAAFGREAA